MFKNIKQSVNFDLNLNELNIKNEDIARMMGYNNQNIPNEIKNLICLEKEFLATHTQIQGGFVIKNVTLVDEIYALKIDGQNLRVGRSIYQQLKNSEKVAIFACTAGKFISSRPTQLYQKGQVLESYITDIIGTIAIEKTVNLLHDSLKQRCKEKNKNVTGRFSPGYCSWDLKEQKKLFSLLPENFCGIHLNKFSLMTPTKSESGLIGIGENVVFTPHNCKNCQDLKCLYRTKK